MKNRLGPLIARFRKFIALFITFGFFKGIVFITPLFLNELLASKEQYGLFEYSLNFGQTLMAFFSVGLPGAYAYFVLKNEQMRMTPVFHFHFVVLTALTVVVAVVSPTMLGNTYFGSCIVGLAFADQLFISGVLKTRDRNHLSIIVDSGLYIVLGVITVLMYCGLLTYSVEIWHASLLLSLIGTALFHHFPNCRNIATVAKVDFKMVYGFGALLLIAGPLTILLTSNTRLFIEYFTNLENVGVYSFFFRIAAGSLILYRIIGIMLYKNMFLEAYDSLDRKMSTIMSIIFGMNILILIFSLIYLPTISGYSGELFKEHKSLLLFCLFQVNFWINFAMFEAIIQREKQLKGFIVVLLVGLGLLLTTLFAASEMIGLDLESIVIINTLAIFVMFYLIHFLLIRKQVYFRRSILIHSLQGVVFLIAITL